MPAEVGARYPTLPIELVEFLGGLTVCENAAQTTWFLCEADYRGTSGAAFRWDEWERMSLEALNGETRGTTEVREFWDVHFPFMFSVRSGYAYFAVRTAADGFGRVVTGREPEFEQASAVAESFDLFLRSLLGRGSPA